MKTVLIEAEIVEELEGGTRVRLLTDLGNPSVMVHRERIIEYDKAPVEAPEPTV